MVAVLRKGYGGFVYRRELRGTRAASKGGRRKCIYTMQRRKTLMDANIIYVTHIPKKEMKQALWDVDAVDPVAPT